MVSVNGWSRICPDCGNNDGTKVERIAFHPTFRCECGYVWDGSRAKFCGTFDVDGHATDEELHELPVVITERMKAAASANMRNQKSGR
jgi:hypothetical protein